MDQNQAIVDALRDYDLRQYEKALPTIKKMAKKGDIECMYRLGLMSYHGQGMDKNPLVAFDSFQKAALELHVGAMYWLGRLYEEGFGTTQNYVKAVEYYTAAGTKGNDEAIVRTAEIYDQGLIGERKRQNALELFVELSKKNHPYATYMIGMAYLNGDGVQKSAEHAFSWLNKALLNGSVDAMNRFRLIGTKSKSDARSTEDIFVLGKNLALSKKSKNAQIYLEIASQEGVVEANLLLAKEYESGTLGSIDHKKCVEYLNKAAIQNHPEALFLLAKKIEKGEGAPSSAIEAAQYFERAAALGHPASKIELTQLRGY
ncbi:MAG: SEL1-like repeat protein [Bacillus subtilis]|nr:SEL1-like repeat protein [Bacillus subtilis]